jgi:hypothetical protein
VIAPLCNGRPAMAHDFSILVDVDRRRLRVCDHCGVLEVSAVDGLTYVTRYFEPWTLEGTKP